MALAKRDISMQPRVMRLAGVVPQAQGLAHAVGNGDDVLCSSADLHADDVRRGIDAQVARREELLEVQRRLLVGAGHAGGRGKLAGYLLRMVGAGEHRDALASAQLLDEDVNHGVAGLGLDALGQDDDRAAAVDEGLDSLRGLAHGTRGGNEHDALGTGAGLLEAIGAPYALKLDVFEIARVPMGLVDGGRGVRVVRPQRHLYPLEPQKPRDGSAPGTRADDSDLTHCLPRFRAPPA